MEEQEGVLWSTYARLCDFIRVKLRHGCLSAAARSVGQGSLQNSVLALGDGHDGAVALGQPAEVHVADQGPVLPLSGRQIGTAEG